MTSETANPLSIIESVLRNEAWSSSERALFTALEKLQALAAKTTELNAIPFLEKLAGKTMAELVPAVFRYLGELPKIKDDAAAVQELLKIADKCAADKSARSAAQAEGTARVVAANMPQESIEHEAAGYAQAAAASARNALACLSDMDIPIDFVASSLGRTATLAAFSALANYDIETAESLLDLFHSLVVASVEETSSSQN